MLYVSSFWKMHQRFNEKKSSFSQKIFWPDFGSKGVKNCQMLVRFSGKIGQIVSQILKNFSQILIIIKLIQGVCQVGEVRKVGEFCFS